MPLPRLTSSTAWTRAGMRKGAVFFRIEPFIRLTRFFKTALTAPHAMQARVDSTRVNRSRWLCSSCSPCAAARMVISGGRRNKTRRTRTKRPRRQSSMRIKRFDTIYFLLIFKTNQTKGETLRSEPRRRHGSRWVWQFTDVRLERALAPAPAKNGRCHFYDKVEKV